MTYKPSIYICDIKLFLGLCEMLLDRLETKLNQKRVDEKGKEIEIINQI